MKITACYKWVLDEQDIKISPGNFALDTSRAKSRISEYDKNAMEEAVLLAESCGAETSAMTFGSAAAKASLKDALSRGPVQAIWIKDARADHADGQVTAMVLAAAIQKVGCPDLLLFGEGSSDQYGQQVGPRVAALLDIPVITFASAIEIAGESVIVTRKLEDCVQQVTVKMPVLVTVLPEINKPRIPSLKQVLGAAKKKVTEFSIADLALTEAQLLPKTKMVSLQGFVMKRKNQIYKNGTTSEMIAGLVENLHKDGVL